MMMRCDCLSLVSPLPLACQRWCTEGGLQKVIYSR
jgi:hypothetical protein